jgi:hypothetical protein
MMTTSGHCRCVNVTRQAAVQCFQSAGADRASWLVDAWAAAVVAHECIAAGHVNLPLVMQFCSRLRSARTYYLKHQQNTL